MVAARTNEPIVRNPMFSVYLNLLRLTLCACFLFLTIPISIVLSISIRHPPPPGRLVPAGWAGFAHFGDQSVGGGFANLVDRH